ncbi:MAG: (2Fe-2S)-binding protein [SAR324 cluster bacterium]|nr:(2Fe-2S)-binding protein [SAR324 cluster bacterium]
MEKISLTVNGQLRELEVTPETPLLYVLRNDLGLTGTKYGCGLEQCGACAVIKNGEKIYSCNTPVDACRDSEVTTIEGIGTLEKPHPIQAAFIEERAAQCGYCIPGMIIASKVLLDKHQHPDDKTIRQELSDHLCRCGTHPRILRAVKRADQEVNS